MGTLVPGTRASCLDSPRRFFRPVADEKVTRDSASVRHTVLRHTFCLLFTPFFASIRARLARECHLDARMQRSARNSLIQPLRRHFSFIETLSPPSEYLCRARRIPLASSRCHPFAPRPSLFRKVPANFPLVARAIAFPARGGFPVARGSLEFRHFWLRGLLAALDRRMTALLSLLR